VPRTVVAGKCEVVAGVHAEGFVETIKVFDVGSRLKAKKLLKSFFVGFCVWRVGVKWRKDFVNHRVFFCYDPRLGKADCPARFFSDPAAGEAGQEKQEE
jgi:hypothetical protein